MRTILTIDDDQDLCEELGDRIVAMGHDGICVHRLEDALSAIDHSGTAINLILLDLEIPVKPEGPTRRETGLNLLDRIVSKPGIPPIIVITSHVCRGMHEAAQTIPPPDLPRQLPATRAHCRHTQNDDPRQTQQPSSKIPHHLKRSSLL